MQDHIERAEIYLTRRQGTVLERQALCATLRTLCDKLEYGVPERGIGLRVASKLETHTRALQAEFIDYLIQFAGVKNDLALSKLLKTAPPLLCKYRHALKPIGAAFILCVHETLGMDIRHIKQQLCMPLVASMVKQVAA